MATLKYYLRNQSICVRFNLSATHKIQLATGLKIDPKQWNAKEGSPKKNNAENKQILTILQNLERSIYEKYTADFSQNKTIDTDWLKQIINEFFNKSSEKTLLFSAFIQKYIDNAPLHKNQKGGTGLSKNTLQTFKQFQNSFTFFEEKTKKKYTFADISNKTAQQFKEFLLKEGFALNTIKLFISKFKVICNYADGLGEKINIRTEKIQSVGEKKQEEDIVTLSFEELDRIAALENLSASLENAQKWLLLGCEVGQRASDLLKLTTENIKGEGENRYFELKQQKTDKKVLVPLTQRAKKIVLDFPKTISYNDFLKNIKIICQLAGIDTPTQGRQIKTKNSLSQKIEKPKYELIGTHTCRRSFATNYYGKIPTSLIKAVTGHATEEMLLNYIGKTPADNLQMLFETYKQNDI